MHEIEPPPDDDMPAAPAAPGKRRRPELTPAQRALGLLVRREHSRKELTRKLTARGVEADDAQAAVERMTAEGWQDDARFAELLVRSRANNGYGPAADPRRAGHARPGSRHHRRCHGRL